MKSKGLLIQFIGLLFLLGGTRGFYVFRGPISYFVALITGVVIFTVCLFWGGTLYKRGKEEK